MTAPRPADLDRRALALLSLGHLTVDTCQGAVPALLPFLIAARGYTVAAAAVLVMGATVASSVVQPVFGILSDRVRRPWMMPAGVAVAGVGIALAGALPTYVATLAAVVVSGLGVAAYHPEGSRSARLASGARKGTGMSLFSVGGNAGFALGPILVTPLVLGFGLTGTLALLVLPAIVAVVLTTQLGRLEHPRTADRADGARGGAARPATAAGAVAAVAAEPAGEGVDRPGAFARLAGAVACRSVLYFGLLTFVPIWFVRELHTSKATGNGALTVMLISGATGTLIGGRLADRFGARRVFVFSMALAVPMAAGFLAVGVVPAFVLLGLAGGTIIATFSVSVVLGQALLPSRVGVASGITLGLSIGIGGMAAALLGLLADATSLTLALGVAVAFGALAGALGWTVPDVGGRASRPVRDAPPEPGASYAATGSPIAAIAPSRGSSP